MTIDLMDNKAMLSAKRVRLPKEGEVLIVEVIAEANQNHGREA